MDGLHNGAARSKFRVHALAREVSQNLKSLTQRSKEAIKAGPLRCGPLLTPWGARNQLTHVRAWAPLRSVTRSRAFPLLVWSERRRAGQRLRIDDCYGWPIGASHDRTAPRVGKRGAACFGGRSRSGYPSLLLRPLFPNLLVTGVLSHACLGTCVF